MVISLKRGDCSWFSIYLIEIPSYIFLYSRDVSYAVVRMFSVVESMDAKWREMFQSEAMSSSLLMSLKF